MDNASATEARDSRQSAEEPQQGPPRDFESDNEAGNDGNGLAGTEITTQERGGAKEDKEDSENEERQQFMVKLKYNNRSNSNPSPAIEHPERVTPDKQVQEAKPSDGSTIVKQEPGDDGNSADVASQGTFPGQVHIKDENARADDGRQPLSASAGKVEPEERQMGEHVESSPGGDKMAVEAAHDSIRVSGNYAVSAEPEAVVGTLLDRQDENISGDPNKKPRDNEQQDVDVSNPETKKVEETEDHSHSPGSFNVGPSNFGLEAQDLQLFPGPVQFPQEMRSPGRQRSQPPLNAMSFENLQQYQHPTPHTSQQRTAQYTQQNSDPTLERQQELERKIAEKRKQLALYQQKQQNSFGFSLDQMSRASPVPLGPLSYQRAPPSGYQQTPFSASRPNFQYPTQVPMGYGHMSPEASYPAQPYYMSMMPPHRSNLLPGQYNTQAQSSMQQQNGDEHDCDDQDSTSDDDEPLKTRVKRHPSVLSQTSVRSNTARKVAAERVHAPHAQDSDSEPEFLSSNPKTSKPPGKNPVRMPRPLPQPTAPDNTTSPAEENETIDFRLPQFEVQRQPLAKNEDLPTAKVSIPGLVREELYLSPDHTNQEIHLLLNLFLPAQQCLPVPDPSPAIAVLNFHTIATMVIEAFVQFEIGDEQGLGRGHFHTQHDQGEEEYERWSDATEANVDDIFFAVVDRWRAGLESKKQSLELIRGAQEFCDVALDVIYYIKEHGLLRGEQQGKKKGRSDKGVKRGPRPKNRVEEERLNKEREMAKGKKRGEVGKPNEVVARKKPKVEPKVEVKRKPRAKAGVTVITGKKK